MAFLPQVANKAQIAGQKTKLKAELLLLDKQIRSRQKLFGIEVYDEMADITCEQDFYATADPTIATIRPQLLEVDREIRALDGKQKQRKDDLDMAQTVRSQAFPFPAQNIQEKTMNLGKNIGMTANETKLKISLNAIKAQTKKYKESFGLKLWPVLIALFGESSQPIEVHSATDKLINRFLQKYIECRADIEEIDLKRTRKLNQIDSL